MQQYQQSQQQQQQQARSQHQHQHQHQHQLQHPARAQHQQQQLELLQQQQLSAAVVCRVCRESVEATGGRQCPGGFAIDLIIDLYAVRGTLYVY